MDYAAMKETIEQHMRSLEETIQRQTEELLRAQGEWRLLDHLMKQDAEDAPAD